MRKFTDDDECSVCGESLDNPIEAARGHHHDCAEKAGDVVIQK